MLNSKMPPPGKCSSPRRFSSSVIELDMLCQTRLPSSRTLLSDRQLAKLSSRGKDSGVQPGPAFSDTDMRVSSLERDIQFLIQEHSHTLKQLHAEIDSLKRQNKGKTLTDSDEIVHPL